MAWPDGSRFLIAHGVKWGNGPKVYKGSKHDTEWNNDLLWKKFVEEEAGKMGYKLPDGPTDIEAMPPFMRPLACALNKDIKNVQIYDPYYNDPAKTCQVQSARLSPLQRLKLKKAYPHTVKLPPTPKSHASGIPSSARSARSMRSSRSQGSIRQSGDLTPSSSAGYLARASARSSASRNTNTRIAAIEAALERERRERNEMSKTLREEASRRERVERDLQAYKERMEASNMSQASVASKLERYERIMNNLVKAVERAEKKK